MERQAGINKLGAKSMGALAKGAALVGAAQGMFSFTQSAIQFESAMADVRKTVDFDTPQQFKQMSSDILELSTRLPMTANGLAAIVAAGGQSGIARMNSRHLPNLPQRWALPLTSAQIRPAR